MPRLPQPLPTLLFHLCLLHAAVSFKFSSIRDSQSSVPQPPATLFVPLNFDSNGRYTVNISLPVSSSQNQSFTFALSTSTGYSSVAGQGCSSCGGSPTYSLPSSIQVGTAQNFSVLDGGVAGPITNQTCNLELQNGSSWSWTDQSFIVANQSSSIFSSDISGIMGIGTNSREGSFNETPMGFWLANNPTQTNFSYGLALNSPNDASNDAGTLHWLAPDENSYEGDVVWKSLIASNSTNSVNADSFVEMDSWNYQGNGVNISAYTGLLTVVDPLFNDLVFPQNQARSIYETIPGSSRQDTLSTTSAYTLPCDTQLQLTLTFGTVSVTLTEAQLIQDFGNSTCLGVLQEWASENVTEYLLGASLISNIYLIFQGSESGSSFGFANRVSTTSSALKAESIAGVVLGSLAFLIMVVIASILFLRWRRRRKLKSMPRVTPYQYGTRPPSAASLSLETTELIPGPLPPTSLRNPDPQYILASTGSRATNISSGAHEALAGSNRSSKRGATRSLQQPLNVINLPVATPTQSTFSTHSYYTDNSASRGDRSSSFFIRVSPPLQSAGHVVIQPEGQIEGGGLLQSNPSVTSLPPYNPTDPDPGARGRLYQI